MADPKKTKPATTTDTTPETTLKDVVTTADVETNAADTRKPKRRLRQAAPSIREQSEMAAARANNPNQTSSRPLLVRIIRFPFLVILWPFRMLFRYVIRPPFRFLNKFKFFRIIGYIFVPPYFRQSWKELRQVTWPNFSETLNLTVAVIIFSIIFGIIIAAVDYGLDKLFKAVILNK